MIVKLHCYSLLILFLLQRQVLGGSRWCYECGTGVEGTRDCNEFALASSWKPFLKECNDDDVCVKIVPGWNHSLYSRTIRGCSPQLSLSGRKHKPGCWSHENSDFISCYCYEDSCNSTSSLQSYTSFLTILVFILKTVLL